MSKPISSGMNMIQALRRSSEFFPWLNQVSMAVIILSPPYFFSALHSSRLVHGCFIPGSSVPLIYCGCWP